MWSVPKGSSMVKTRKEWASRNNKSRGHRWSPWPSARTPVVHVRDNTQPIADSLVPIDFGASYHDPYLILLVNNQWYYHAGLRFMKEVASTHGIRLGWPLAGEYGWYKQDYTECELFLVGGTLAQKAGLGF